ncbi:hypothetical protein EDD37DRAFT_645035 [Exophiala viscosa]|uniref:uncharacterized protein n=1 Tax=Exophiala viscosa TaxID=2486360 RepID=UPI002199FDBF|nr:hypothetical protein EDD37DRAFT_645035 [Exophiala viscosa]
MSLSNAVSEKERHGLLLPDEEPQTSQSVAPRAERHESINGDLGYSLAKGSNAFMSLTHVLDGDDDFQIVASAHNQPALSTSFSSKAQAIIAQLPSRPAIDSLVTFHFSDVNWYYFMVEEYYFRDLLERWSGDPSALAKHVNADELSWELRYFPAMLFQVLALAIQFLTSEAPTLKGLSKNDLALCHNYSDTGIELLSSLGFQASAATVVQTHLLRSAWLKNMGRGVDAWHSTGNAIRSAQEIGLHQSKEFRQQGLENTLSRIWYHEYQKRIWMNLYIWDSLIAMILGRPRTINADECDVDDRWTATSQRTHQPQCQCQTNMQTVKMFKQMKALSADKPFPKDYSTITRLHNQLKAMLDDVPATLKHQNPDTSWNSQYPYLKQQRELILTYANLFLMTLHRPHVANHADSCRCAVQASVTALESLARSFALTAVAQYKSFALSFYTVDASIFLSCIVAIYPPIENEVQSRVDHVLRQALHRCSSRCIQSNSQCPGVYDFAMSTTSARLAGPQLPLAGPLHKTASQDLQPHDAMPTLRSTSYSRDPQQIPSGWSAAASQSDSYHSVSTSGEDTLSTMADVSLLNTPTDFDESYWMSLMNSIAPVSGTVSDGNAVWSGFS